jgi:hypothetical protein
MSVIREGSTSPVRSSGRDASGGQPLSPRWGWPDPEKWNRRGEVEVRYVYSCHSLRLMFRSPLYVLCVTRHPPEQVHLRMSSALQYNQGTHALPWVHPRPNNPNEQCRLGRLGARASRSRLYVCSLIFNVTRPVDNQLTMLQYDLVPFIILQYWIWLALEFLCQFSASIQLPQP